MKITFTQSSGLQDSVFGKHQHPIQMMIKTRGEEFEKQSVVKELFMMNNTKNYGDVMTTMTAMTGFMPVGELGASPVDGMQEGFQKFLQQMTWKNSFSLSREIVEDSKLMDLRKKPEAFLVAYNRTREQFGAALYGGAISGQTKVDFKGKQFDVTGADDKPLFDRAHPAKVKGSAQSNKFSDAFSADALGKLETAMQNFRGDNKELLDVAPDTILIPNHAGLKQAVFAAIGADKDPVTANNAFNYQYGRWTVIVWNYLNDFAAAGTAPWILLDSKYNKLYGGAVWNNRVELDVTSTVDHNTSANVWWGYSRYNACFNDWRFAAAGGVSGGDTL
jgi:hypothetical protein